MKKLILSVMFILIISSSIIPVFAYTIIPPTNAIERGTTSNGTVSALNYSSLFNFVGIGGIVVKGSQAQQKIIIDGSGISGGGGGGFGTYNVTKANNVIINSKGNSTNFINGTNNPIHIVNDPTRNQVNITISDTTGSGGAAPKVVINGNNRSSFLGIIANQTFHAPQVSINGNNRSSFTGVLNSTTFKANSITCINQFISAYNNSTGLFTCSTATASISINGLSRSTFTGIIANQTFPAPQVQINSVNSSSHVIGADSPISISNSSSTHTISCPTCLTSSSSGIPVVLAANTTTGSITSLKTIWTIPLTANSGNAIEGVLLASTNTAGAAVQVGANVTNTHGQGSCTFSYASAATTGTYFSGVLSTTSTDSAWTAIVTGANQPYPIYFNCAVATDSTAVSLKINFQAEVASTVSIKAGSYYIKTP